MKTQPIRVDWRTLSPYVRFVHETVIGAGVRIPERIIYDHEFVFVIKGTGTFRIEDRIYPMEPGTLIYLRPHIVNEMTVDEQEPMRCFAVHFDYIFLGEAADFSPYAAYLGRKQDGLSSDMPHKRPYAEIADIDIPEMMNPAQVQPFYEMFRELCRRFEEPGTDKAIWLKADMMRLIGHVLHELTNEDGVSRTHAHAGLVLDATQFMKERYSGRIELETLAGRAGLTPKYFGTLFKQATGQSFSRYLLAVRLEAAKQLLRQTDCTIEEISDRVGIGDIYYFSKLFKKAEGMSPTKYRDSLKWLQSRK